MIERLAANTPSSIVLPPPRTRQTRPFDPEISGAGFPLFRCHSSVGTRRWRCGESNPGPSSPQRRHLRAQSSASFGHRDSDDEFLCAYPELA